MVWNLLEICSLWKANIWSICVYLQSEQYYVTLPFRLIALTWNEKIENEFPIRSWIDFTVDIYI